MISLKTRLVYKFLPTLLSSIKLLHRVGATPVFLTVTDISPGAGLYTDPIPALSYLQSQVANISTPQLRIYPSAWLSYDAASLDMVIMLSLCAVQGVDLVYSVPGLVVIIDKLARYLYDMNIAESEVQPQGYCTVGQFANFWYNASH